MNFSDNTILKNASRILEERLPKGWVIERIDTPPREDGALRFTSSEGRSCIIPVDIKQRIDPRNAQQLETDTPRMIVAPYLSQAVRESLEERGICYADQTGNTRVVIAEPGLFILTAGAESNPWPPSRQLTLRGIKAGRLVLALANSLPPLGVRELAEIADTDPGYVSRLLKMLDREALVDRTSRGRVEHVDWQKLLLRWASDAPLTNRAVSTTWLAPRGLKTVVSGLRREWLRYLITGSEAAQKVAPITPTRLLSIYVEDPDEVAEKLGLRRTDAGANIILLQPEDRTLYERASKDDGLNYAPLPLVVADLLGGPGRSPAEAEALLEWMHTNEEVWRG